MSEWMQHSLIAFIPGLLWVIYFYRKDLYEPEPKAYILQVFGFGALAVLPAAAMEKLILFAYPGREIPQEYLPLFIFCLLVVGLTEEFWKYAAVRYSIYKTAEFDEQPMDGLLYGVTAGLGFASLENLFYTASFGVGTGAVRAVITSLAHASFSGIMGYNLGLARLFPSKAKYYSGKGLLLASTLHGLYDFVFLSKLLPWIVTAPLVFLVIWQLFRRFQTAQIDSPFRTKP